MDYRLLKIVKSDKKDKKYMAVFINKTTNREKIIHFGAIGYSDYTIHKDDNRKALYISRHKNNEDWNNPITAGSLSRWILWNLPTLGASIKDYRRRFNI